MKPAVYCRFCGVRILLIPISLLLTMHTLAQPMEMNGSQKLLLNEVNSSAARHLLKNFSPTGEVTWYLEKNGYVALCNEGNLTARVYYKLNGNFEGCTKYYLADAMDENRKSVLMTKFPGCKILMVTEITNFEKQELFVKIKDGSFIRTIHFSDEGVEVTENILDAAS